VGWALGRQTSVVAFDIAQFFPSLNHQVLLRIIDLLGFPAVVGNFFKSYLVGRRTTYRWDSFTSGSYAADVGVGQGSALSPVVSALYLAPVIKLFLRSPESLGVDIMSYVDDGTIMAQNKRLEDNLPALARAYGWIVRAFTSLGLVLEHDKSEVFHFSRSRGFRALPIDLGYAPFTGATPLRPKPVWRYLGFFFDRRLLFKEHIRFYTTKALTSVKSMGMLGNSVWGLDPMQKRLLYRSCVVPVMTYGLRLWYFKGARVKGTIKALAQVQSMALRWISGCFRTTPIGGMEALVGLLPMHLLLRRLAEKGALRASLLAPSHPLRTILGAPLRGSAPAHALGLAPSGLLSTASLLGPSVDSATACASILRDEADPFGVESCPGYRVRDLFEAQTSSHAARSRDKDDIAAYIRSLDAVWAEACADPSCLWLRTVPFPNYQVFRRWPAPSSSRGGSRLIVVCPLPGGGPPRRWSDLRSNSECPWPWPGDAPSWWCFRTPSLPWRPCLM
jgi:hypothetical protein